MTRTLPELRTDLLYNLSRATRRSLVRPDWVSINLTLRCNLHCPMCNTCYDVPRELTTREVKDIIDQVALWGVRILNPLGGEPFMRDDLVELLEYACLKDFYITLTTNGTLISPEAARGIARIAYDRLHFNISIDGPREVHDRVRGPDTFDRALEGYRLIRDADEAAGNPPRKIVVNTVVNDLNLDAIPAFVRWCEARGFQGIQLLTLFQPETDSASQAARALGIPKSRWSDLDRMVDQVLAFRRETDPLRFTVANTPHELEIMKRHVRGDLPPRRARCYAGWKELYINADGEAIMCDGHLDFLAGRFGNVRTRTLQELWASPELRERRKAVKACSRPCIQDCYLRESSDSLMQITREFTRIAARAIRARLRPPRRDHVVMPGTSLCLELSDVSDVNPGHDPFRSAERFAQLCAKLEVPFDRCYEDPFEYYDMRNRGYLNFNRGFMGFELVKKFVPELEQARVQLDEVRLGWRGDPLLHPEFVPIYRFLLDRSGPRGVFRRIRVDTFATLMNTEYVDVALEATNVPQTWFIVLDAATPESYRRVNGADLFNVVSERLDYLVARKVMKRAEQVRLVLVLTVLKENLSDAVAFREFWTRRLTDQGLSAPAVVVGGPLPGPSMPAGPLVHAGRPGQETGAGDILLFRREDASTFLEQREANERLSRVARDLGVKDPLIDRDTGRAPRCAGPFKTPTVSWDGKVTVCDRDRFLKLRLGEVTRDDLVDIWWRGPHVKELRTAVYHGRLHFQEPCRHCRYPFSPNALEITRAELETWSRGGGT